MPLKFNTTRHKFNAKATVVDGIRFASKAEARRYSELKLLEKAGEIAHLVLQPSFMLLIWDCELKHDVQIGSYVADFQYWDTRAEKLVIEDVKGVQTPVYKLKKKIVEHRLGITITEVGQKRLDRIKAKSKVKATPAKGTKKARRR